MQEINDTLLKKAVQFGCVVTISYKDQKGTEFFVLSEGFTNIKMRMRTAEDIRQRGIMSQCLFRLIPTLAYTEYNKGKQQFDTQQPGIVNQRQARQVLPKQIKAMEAESQINAEQYSKLKGQSIFYGQSIQLQHVDSEKYLSFSENKGPEYENDGWLAFLKSEHGEDTFFKILSSFSFQQETGGYIFDGDTISIVSTCDQLSEPGLHASQAKKSNSKKKFPKLELNVSTPSYLKINIFSKPSDEQQFLSVFDCFWITYSEQNLNLIVQKFTPDQDRKYLKFLAGDQSDSGDSNGMFVVENTDQSDFSKGGYVRWTEKYRIKHLTSGYYLAIQKYEIQNKELRSLIAVQEIQQASEFKFELIYATIGTKNKEQALQFLERDSFFRLIESDQYIAKFGIDPDGVYQIEGSDYIEQIQIPIFNEEKKDDNVLKLNRIDDNDVRLTRYLLSCMKSISRSDQYLDKQMSFDAAGKTLYMTLMDKSTALIQNINALEALCYNKLDGYVSFEGGYGQSSERIQTLLREQYFFETLVRILVICFNSVEDLKKNYTILTSVSKVLNDSNNTKLLEDQVYGRCLQKKREICQHVYKLIAAMCHKNQQNQEYASKYLPIFAMQSLYLDNMSTILAIIKDYEELLLNLSKNVMIDGKQEKRKRKNTQTKQVFQTKSKQDDYDSEYSILAKEILEKVSRVSIKWDLLSFYSSMLASSKDFTKKIQIVKFLRQAVQLDQRGINVNQELSYKNIVANDADVFKNEVLVRIKSDGPQLKVYRNGDEATLLEYFDKHNKKDPQIYPSFVPYIQELMQLYSWMCNSRNYTWKKFVENFFNVESLIENIEEPQYTMEIRGIICNMLNKLYVDQEPRRTIIWPELCKVVRVDVREKKLNNSQISQMKVNKVSQEDPVDLARVQQKIKSYLKYMKNKIGNNSGYYDDSQVMERQKIAEESLDIYNSLTLEVMKLFNLMINFGLYVVDINSGASQEDIFKTNEEYFENLRCIIALLEFDVMFPESRKILMELREEDLKKSALKLPNINLNLNFNDIGLGFFDDQAEEKKQKKVYIDEDVSDPSQELSFQKQVEVLKLKMTEYMYASANQAAQIKAEVCEILNQFLDVRMDFLLKNLNNLFTDWVKNDELEKKLNADQDPENIKQIFKQHIKESIAVILPNIMLTGTSVDQDLKPKEDNLPNFNNLINVVRDKVVDNNNELKAIDLHSILGFSIFPVLIQNFCLNEDLVLETKNLQLMTRLYNQRYEFADLSSKLLVLFDAKNIDVYKKSKKRIVELAKFIDESETWVQGLDRDEHLRTLRQVHEQFEYYSKLMYMGSEIDRDGKVVEGHHKKIDPVRQDIMRHLKLDKLGVNLIKDAVFAVDQVEDAEKKQKLKEMFIVCLNFLTLFVKDNPNNQMEMSQNITALVSNLSTDIGQVQLLCEIFRNNKKICTERAHEVIDDFIKLILTNGRQARYLEFFLIVQQIKNEYIPTNQKAVLNLLIDPRFKDQLFYMVKQSPSIAKRRDYPVFDFKIDKSDEPYIYHAKLIEVCASCTIGKDGLLSAENKLKQQITFTYIMELLLFQDCFTVNMEQDGVQEDDYSNELEMLKQAQQFESSALRQQSSPQVSPKMRVLDPNLVTLMKPALQDLLFYTYLESEKIDEEVFKCMNEIVQLVQKERNRLETLTSAIPEFQSYLFNNFMLTINGFIKVFNRELGQQAMQQGSSLQKAVVKFQQEIDQFRTVLVQYVQKNKIRLTDRQKKLYDLFVSELIMQEIDNKDRTLPDEPVISKSETTNKDETWKELWNIFLKEFLDSDILMNAIHDEQVTFAKAILSVEEIYIKKKEDKDDHKKTLAAQINKEEIFKGLIAFLENNSGKQEMRETFKLILNSLQNYLTIVKLEDNLDEIEQKQAREEQLEENQNFLNYNNAMQMTLTLISEDSDIINELVQFGIQMLQGGNRNVQISVWQFFQNFSHSERFFQRMSNILKSATVYKSSDQPKFAFQQQSDLTKNVLRLLQLFAEGHYTELQEYMHEQTLNHHSYDIFENVVELLIYYLKNHSRDNYENMIQTFETITEYIQGPCLVNQQVLLQAGFLDQAQFLLNQNEIQLHLTDNINFDAVIEFNDNEDLLTSNQSIFTREQYSELKYKCTVTLISLLEARVDDEIVQRMQKALKLDMIKMNLTNLIYTFQVDFGEKYSPELFGQEGSHFRIETGFNLYFIYLNFLKLKNQNIGRVKSEEEDVVMENFSNNIFFRLIKFAQSIVNSLQESARETMRLTFQGQKKTADEKKRHYDDTISTIDPFKFFKHHTGSIEIMREDQKLEQVYFPIPPYCKLEKDKEARTKFNEVAIRASNKSKVSSLQKEALEMIKTMKINFKIEQQINRFKTLEVIILNIDLLRDVQFLIALVINILIFLYYQEALGDPIINADGTTTTVYAGSSFEFEDTVNILGILSIILSGLIVAFFLSRNAPLLIDKAWAGVNKDKLNPILYTKRLLKTLFYVLSDFFALYYIAYGAAAVLGRFVHPFFFCFHLFEVMIRFPVLLNVVKSVWMPKYLILGTGLLWLLFMYMFSVFGYLVLYDSYPQGACDSLWVCFLTTIRSAFQYDSGIGGMLTSTYQAYPGQLGMLIIRFLFDNLFNILILIIMLNIVAGIIIDMFGQLREELAEYTEDLQNKCFICGHDKETIEKESTNLQDFKDHIKYEHHQWYYIYYIAYILDKDPTEYTGIESYVAEMIENKNINWFPLDKALCFRKGFGENTEKSIAQQMELLNQQVSGLESNLQDLLKEI